jgi:hypothetical protein
MTIYQTDYAKGVRQMPQPMGSEVVNVRMEFALSAALGANDVVEFGFLPQDCVPVDFEIDSDDLDSGTTATVDFGLLTAAGTAVSDAAADGGAKWLTADDALQTASFTRAASQAHKRVVASSTTARKIGMVLAAGPTTAATGKIGVSFSYRAAHHGL